MENVFDWVSDPALRDEFKGLLAGERPSQQEARTAMRALCAEGKSHLKRYVGDAFYQEYFPTTRRGPKWKEGRPTGVVDHYTAGISMRGTLRWFSSKKRTTPGNSSAHHVISRRGVIVTLVDPLERVAWHAGTRENYTHVGIEHVNAGLLSKSGTKVLYMDRYTYPEDRLEFVQKVGEELWEPYTSAQICSNIVLKRLLLAAAPTMLGSNFVDHETIAPARKKDCGPLWPLKSLNRLVLSWKGLPELKSLKPIVLQKPAVALFNSEIDDLLV